MYTSGCRGPFHRNIQEVSSPGIIEIESEAVCVCVCVSECVCGGGGGGEGGTVPTPKSPAGSSKLCTPQSHFRSPDPS